MEQLPEQQQSTQNDDVPMEDPQLEPELDPETTTTSHHSTTPPGLTPSEFAELIPYVTEFHTYRVKPRHQCSSLLAQKIHAPRAIVWSILRAFDKPQIYKHFIKSCTVGPNFTLAVGSTRDVHVISGLPAATSTERLDMLDDNRCVTGFTIIGGEHRLRNYHSVTTLHTLPGAREGDEWTVVLESYVVDVPEGNTVDDTRLFADTVVKLNLQKLGSVAVGLAREAAANGNASGS
ncbi:abscisic acid receptor PYR1-like [Silene latifolia]|uniref:abscisic acid receptor PYR1-like n=1 Tax=Silene latifolia TaxID=37657 RepID=UPI003D77A932